MLLPALRRQQGCRWHLRALPVPAALRAGASPAAASRGCPGKEPAGTGLWPKDQDGQDVPELGAGCGPVIDPLLPRAHFVPHLISLKAWCWLSSLLRLLHHSPQSHQSPCRSRRQSRGDSTVPWGCSWSPVVMPAASATPGSTPRWDCAPFLCGFAGSVPAGLLAEQGTDPPVHSPPLPLLEWLSEDTSQLGDALCLQGQ